MRADIMAALIWASRAEMVVIAPSASQIVYGMALLFGGLSVVMMLTMICIVFYVEVVKFSKSAQRAVGLPWSRR